MKLSIITAVFNGASTLCDCLESVRTQSYPQKEHILIDGGSTDGTQEILKEHHGGLALVVSELDRGIYDAMNKGIALATGDVVGILNADDFYPHGNVLARVTEVFASDGVECCYGDLNYVYPNDTARITRFWRAGAFDRQSFLWGWMPPHPTFFVRRRIYEKYGAFNLEFGSAADYELMLRFLVKHRIPAAYIPEVLVYMRNGGMSNASLKNRIRAHRMDRQAWEVNGLRPYPWTLVWKPLRKLLQFCPPISQVRSQRLSTAYYP